MKPLVVALIALLTIFSLLVLAKQTLELTADVPIENNNDVISIRKTDLDDLQSMRKKLANSNSNRIDLWQEPIGRFKQQLDSERYQKVAQGFLNSMQVNSKQKPSGRVSKQKTITNDTTATKNMTETTLEYDNKLRVATNESISSTKADSETQIKKSLQNYNYTNAKCHKNKFDRIIAQKMLINDISRPLIDSEGRFDNPFPTWKPPSFFETLQFILLEQNESDIPYDRAELDKHFPIMKPNFDEVFQSNGSFRVTWIGHSTILIQVDGLNILTDPVFSQRASPSQYIGPRRYRDPACEIKALPQINIVLISHNHYDHLDSDSVAELNSRFGDELRWIVPLGLGPYFESMSVRNYVELDWWQKDCFHVGNNPNTAAAVSSTSPPSAAMRMAASTIRRAVRNQRLDLDIYLTPSQHWSRRGISDMRKSLWGSYTLVSSSGATFFFTGDSGYCLAFKEISKIFGPFTGAAIPIGAYKPRWFMRSSHCDPLEAIQIHKDLRSAKSMAIHHGTFALANEHYKEPSMLLQETMEDMRVNQSLREPFTAIKHGSSLEFCKTATC